jgi:hypothetical protein
MNTLVRGGANCVANYQDLSHIFWLLFGSVDTSGAGPYTHVFPKTTGVVTPAPDFTCEVQRDSTALTWRYAGCMLTGIGLAVDVDNEMTCRLDLIGKSEGTGTASTAAFNDFDVVVPSHCTAAFDAASVDATAFNLNIAYAHDEPKVLGSTALGAQPMQNDTVKVTGTMEVLFTDLVEYALFPAATETDITLACTDGTHSFNIDMNKCLLRQATPPVKGRERLMATYDFASYYDAVGTENLQITCINDEATIP